MEGLTDRARRVVQALAESPTGLNRHDLEQTLGISTPTLQRALKELKADDPNWIKEEAHEGAAHILRLGVRAGVIVGVDVGRSHLRTTVADAHGTSLVKALEDDLLNAEEMGPALVGEVVDRVVEAVAEASDSGRL